MKHDLIIILDFGGQYNQLIARRVRDLNVYCEVLPFDTPISKIKEKAPKGIIFTGGPSVVTEKGAPIVDKQIFELKIPILGICYGAQLIAYLNEGEVLKAKNKEYGKTELIVEESILFKDVKKETNCWMSHTYYVDKLPKGFKAIATTKTCKNASFSYDEKGLYALQFHPEVVHTEEGNKIIKNFLYEICKCSGDWLMENIAEEMILDLKNKIGDRKVLCALSGGVDSTVAAILVHKAIGKNLICVFVDHGLLRLNEAKEVVSIFKEEFDINLVHIDATARFLQKLKNISEPETKRKIIGEEFIRVFEEEAKKIGAVDFLVQGTIYPDIIESGTKTSAVIKSHHNVGGLPDVVDFKEIIEPLKLLFKDEVRKLGKTIGIPEELVYRQPFPGPGLAIRIIGEITEEKLKILRETDFIFRDEIKKANLDRDIWQYFTVLTGIKTVGVMGDERTYSYTIALRAVTSMDAMSADWARIPFDILEKISIRMVNEVANINRVVYDITSKPPATIEWE